MEGVITGVCAVGCSVFVYLEIIQKMVSVVILLPGGAFSTICFCKSMKLDPL